MRQFRRHRTPERAHPLVRRLFDEMNHQCIGVLDLADRSGLNKNTISDWRYHTIPNVANLEACYNVLGMTLMPRPIENWRQPPPRDCRPPLMSENPTEIGSQIK